MGPNQCEFDWNNFDLQIAAISESLQEGLLEPERTQRWRLLQQARIGLSVCQHELYAPMLITHSGNALRRQEVERLMAIIREVPETLPDDNMPNPNAAIEVKKVFDASLARFCAAMKKQDKTDQLEQQDGLELLIDAVSNTVLIHIVTELSLYKRNNLIRRSHADLAHCRRLLNEPSNEAAAERPYQAFRVNAIEGFLVILELSPQPATKAERDTAAQLLLAFEHINNLQKNCRR